MHDDGRFNRRQFSRQLAMGTGCLAASLTAIPALGDEVPPPPNLPEDGASAKTPEKPGRQEPPPEVLLLTYLVRTYPSDHFDDEAIQGIFRDIRGDLARGEVLSEFPLKNSDEPVSAFRVYRGADGVPVDG